MDKGNSKEIKLFRGLQGFVEIDEIRSACKVDKLKLNNRVGNGSRKGGGANNCKMFLRRSYRQSSYVGSRQ